MAETLSQILTMEMQVLAWIAASIGSLFLIGLFLFLILGIGLNILEWMDEKWPLKETEPKEQP